MTFLGTGTSLGVPQPACSCPVCQKTPPSEGRRRPSLLLSWEKFSLLVDTSPDLREQALLNHISTIDAVLITHLHRDHTGGFDDLRAFYFAREKKPIPVYATDETWLSLEKQFYFVFRNRHYPGILQIQKHIVSWDHPFSIGNREFIPILLWHHKLKVLGFRTGNFAYLTDLKRIDPSHIDKVKGVDVLVLGVLQKKEHIAHLNVQEALALIDLLKPRTVFFTHIGHGMGDPHHMERTLPSFVRLARDKMKIKIDE